MQSNDYAMNLRRDVFQAISDPTRRAILLLLTSQTMTAGAIASNFDTARPTVSKHLQILTECELLNQEQNGREIYYQINANKMNETILPFITALFFSFKIRIAPKGNSLKKLLQKYRITLKRARKEVFLNLPIFYPST